MSFTPMASLTWGLGSYDDPDVQFNGVDGDGVLWVLESVEGWYSTDAELAVQASAADGGWFGPGRRPSRVLTLTGTMRGSCTADLDAAASRFRTAASRVDGDQVLWAGETIPKQVTVRQSGPVTVDPIPGHKHFRRFTAVLTAADPYKYAAGQSGLQVVQLGVQAPATGGGLIFPLTFPLSLEGAVNPAWKFTVNPGDVPVWPTLSFTGPVVSPAVQHVNSGAVFGVSGQLYAGTGATSQFAYRTLLVDGASARSRRLPGSTYWPIQPGRNDLHLAVDPVLNPANTLSAATGAVLTYRPAWR